MRSEKNQMVQELCGLLKDRSAVLISYQGLTANVFNDLRGKLDAAGATCRVARNQLIRKAAAALDYTDLADVKLAGDTAFLTGEDPVAIVRVVKDFAAGAGKNKVSIKMGFVEGQLLNADDTLALAELPPKEVVLAQILGLLQAPASGIARALNASVAQVVNVVNAYKEKLEKEQTA